MFSLRYCSLKCLFRRFLKATFVVSVATMLGACGQKGALYLPEDQAVKTESVVLPQGTENDGNGDSD